MRPNLWGCPFAINNSSSLMFCEISDGFAVKSL